MKDPKNPAPDFSKLRRQAEQRLRAQTIDPAALPPEECFRLVHELQVHQIELEMQNEELRLAQVQLAQSRDKYTDLYDFAPVAYLTLNKRGQILEANLTAATLLGVEKGRLINRFFSHFLIGSYRPGFLQLLHDLPNNQEQQGEFRLQDGSGHERTVFLNILCGRDAQDPEQYRIAFTDITKLEEMRSQKENLEELAAERTAELRQANAQLQEANEKLEALFQAAPLGIGVFDHQGRFVSANPANERILGWSPSELAGRMIPSFPKQDATEAEALLQRVLQGESLHGVEIKQQRRDGALIDVSLWVAPLLDPEGGFRGFVGLADDISERKRAEEVLQTQSQVLASMAEGVVVTDARGEIVYTNPAFDRMFGYETGELLGRPSQSLSAYSPEENCAVIQGIMSRIKATGAWHGEFHNRQKDGSPFYTEAHLSALKIDGKMLYISVQEDITQRKLSEAALEESEARYRSLFQNNHAVMLLIDPATAVIVDANPAASAYYGYPLEQLKGKKINDINTLTVEQVRVIMQRACSGEQQQFYFQHRLASGEVRDVAVYAGPIRVGGKKLLYSIVHDITERRRLEVELATKAQLLDLSNDSIFVVDPEGNFQYVNEAAYKTRGYSREELLKTHLADLDISQQAEFIPVRTRMIRENGEASFESAHRRKDGSVMPVEVYVKQIQMGGREILLSSVRDITARFEAEEALRRSNQRLDLLAETASLLLASKAPEEVVNSLCRKLMFFLDCDVFFNFLVDAAERRLHLNAYEGITAEEAQRLEWIDYGAGLCGYTAQEGCRIVAEDIAGTPDSRAELIKSYGIQAYACHPLLIEGEVLGTLAFGTRRRRRFTAEELALMQAVADQVAIALERKRAEESLKNREARLASILATVPAGIGLVQDRVITEFNQQLCLITGYAPEELFGKSARILYPSQEDFDYVGQEKYDQIARQGTGRVTTRWCRRDGGLIDVLLSSAPLDGSNPDAGVTFTALDITDLKQATEALKHERDFSAALLNTLGALVVVLDRDGRIVRFNQACEISTGYAFTEIEGKYFFEIFLLPEEKASVQEVFQRLTVGNIPVNHENHWLTRTGEKHLISWSNTTLTAPDGSVAYIIGTGIDITKQRRAEEALRQAHNELERRVASRTEQLRHTVDKLLQEIAVRERAEARLRESEARFAAFMRYLPGSAIMRDRAGRFLFVNESWEKTLGRNPGESLGKTVDDFWPPEIARRLKEFDQQVFLQNRPMESEVELLVGGRRRTFLTYRFPIQGETGEVEMVGAIGIDITDRLRAEETRDRLIAILEATPDFVGSADREGQLFYLNRAAREMLGLAAQGDITDLNFSDTQPPWALELIASKGRPVYARQGVWQGETAILCRDGIEIPVSQVILVHRGLDGKVKFFSTICRDISDMKRAEEKLRFLTTQLLTAQEDERKRLASELHDELGHALLTLKLHLSGVERHLLPEQVDLKEKMRGMVAYLTDTVEEVRRLYHDLSPGDLEDLGLTTALRNMLEDYQELYQDIDWQVELADIDNLFPLPIQTMIYRIVQEALTNIGKHAYPDHVKVKVTREDRQAVFIIDDDGRGFSMDDVLDGDIGKRGMGLGAMAQRVSLAGGVFDLWSRENQGARIVFVIPYNQAGVKV